jgi:hypothetical protein
MPDIFRHIKNGKLYQMIAVALDKTSDKNIPVVVYHPELNPNRIYVREFNEFYEKFQEIEIKTERQA